MLAFVIQYEGTFLMALTVTIQDFRVSNIIASLYDLKLTFPAEMMKIPNGAYPLADG